MSLRMFTTDVREEGAKCGGCNYQTVEYFGMGDTLELAKAQFEADETYGLGLCSHCMIEVLQGNYEISIPVTEGKPGMEKQLEFDFENGGTK